MMKTIREIKRLNYSLLGLLVGISFLNISCNKITEYSQNAEFYFVNKTNHVITYNKPFEKYNVAPNSTTLVRQYQDAGGKNVTAEGYHRPFTESGGNLILKFDQDKCVGDHHPDSLNSILNLKNYVAEKIGKRTYKFTYTFTEADYNRAVACP